MKKDNFNWCSSKMTQMLELVDKDFKAAIIEMLRQSMTNQILLKQKKEQKISAKK